jgi:hypothetical protein
VAGDRLARVDPPQASADHRILVVLAMWAGDRPTEALRAMLVPTTAADHNNR